MADRARDRVTFYPVNPAEHSESQNKGVFPKHKTFPCGYCGATTNGRVVCDMQRKPDDVLISWCLCSCGDNEPTIILEKPAGTFMMQAPIAREFHSKDSWPPDLAKLYEDAAKAYSAGAFTAASMVCRKILMSCACHEGADENKTFADYVGHITDKVLTFDRAKDSIDAIRGIGNDANHDLAFVTQDNAKRAMVIVTYLLDTLYTLPTS